MGTPNGWLRTAAAAMFAICLYLPFQSPALAATYNFTLKDHRNGSLSNSPDNLHYGIRLDQYDKLFSMSSPVGSVNMTVDDSLGTAIIQGIVVENSANPISNGPAIFGSSWFLEYEFTGLTFLGMGAFTATGGAGTLTEDVVGGLTYNLSSYATTGPEMLFKNDGHRIPGNTGWVGRGWIEDIVNVNRTTNDFLFEAMPGGPGASIPQVPVPAALPLILSGLGLIGLMGRRRKTAA